MAASEKFNRSRNLLWFITAIGMAVAASGCAVPRKSDYPVAYPSPAAALKACEKSVPSGVITATAKIEITDNGERYPLKAAVMLKSPNSLRLESIPLFGLPDFFMTIDKTEMRIFMPAKGCFCTGAATPENIEKFLHVKMGGTDLVSLLLGAVPGSGKIDETYHTLTGRQEERNYRVDREDGEGGLLSIWINPSINGIFRISLSINGVNVYDALFENRLMAKELLIPQHITVTRQPATELKIKYSEIRQIPNAEASFDLPVPEGITPTSLDRAYVR
jgi:hypothetical protein